MSVSPCISSPSLSFRELFYAWINRAKDLTSLPRLSLSQTLTTGVFVRAVVAVLVAVAEEAALDAVAVAAGQVVLLADGLVGEEERLDLLLLRLGLAVRHGRLPVARLLLDVERQAGRTPDGLQALELNSYM